MISAGTFRLSPVSKLEQHLTLTGVSHRMYAFIPMSWFLVATFVFGLTAQADRNRTLRAQQLIRNFESRRGYPDYPQPRDVTEIAVIGQSSTIPFLRNLVRAPDGPSKDPALRLAAVIALLRLDDRRMYAQTRSDLDSHSANRESRAIATLATLDNKEAAAILVQFLQRTEGDRSVVHSYGDTGWDPRTEIMRNLSCMLPSSVTKPDREREFSVRAWLDWWQKNGDALPENFNPPRPFIAGDKVSELLDKIEWRFDSNAVLQLASLEGTEILPYLRDLAHSPECVVPPSRYFGGIAGNAQAAGAKMGGEDLFQEIVAELSSEVESEESDAIKKLEYIGTERAIGVLVKFLDDRKFPKNASEVGFNTNPMVMALRALSRLVPNGPVPGNEVPKRDDIERWQLWWNRSKRFR